MPNEVYAYKLFVQFRSRVSTTKLFFAVDNTTGAHPFELARGIGFTYFALTDWGLQFNNLLSTHCFLRGLHVKRIRPAGGAAYRLGFRPDQFPGNFVGQCAENLTCANIQWIVPGDTTGKHQIRVSPLGEGATQTNGWHPILELAAAAFAQAHVTPTEVLPGLFSAGCINHAMSGGSLITNAQLIWPPGRQSNRRVIL